MNVDSALINDRSIVTQSKSVSFINNSLIYLFIVIMLLMRVIMRVILFKIFEDKELLLLLSHKEKDLFNFKNYIER